MNARKSAAAPKKRIAKLGIGGKAFPSKNAAIPKKRISEISIGGKPFLLKKPPLKLGALYCKDGFQRDCTLSSLLWKKGICPKTICGKGWMLQEKVRHARMLSYSRDAALAGRLLAKLHSIKVSGRVKAALGKMDCCKMAFASRLSEKEKRQLEASHPALAATLDGLFETILLSKPLKGKKCLCHHDAVAQNFLVFGKKAYLIDFEWASLDYPESDLASFLSPFAAAWSHQAISPSAARQFLSSYCQVRGIPVAKTAARLDKAAPFIWFIHLSWAARVLLSHRGRHGLGSRERAELSYARECVRLAEVWKSRQ